VERARQGYPNCSADSGGACVLKIFKASSRITGEDAYERTNSNSGSRRSSSIPRRDRRTYFWATDMSLVAEASNGREAITFTREYHPDIVLMDLQMAEMNGLDATMTICREFPDTKIIVLTTYSGDVQVLRALKAGARAYLLKNLVAKDLLETIRAVHAGKRTLSPEISYQLAEHATNDPLTPAEIAVLRQIAAGSANKEIAAQLSMSEESVKGRVRSILSKLGAKDRTDAAIIGIRRGIVEL
jgi:DNA-binding NarL/FixJ family response regulator